MTARRTSIAAVCLALSVLGVAVATAYDSTVTSGAERQQDAAANQSANDLAVRAAEIELELSKNSLAKINDYNQRIPGAISAPIVERYEMFVKLAEQRLKTARDSAGDHGALIVAWAESNLREAQDNLRRAEAANVQAPGAVASTDLERLQLLVEFQKVAVEQARQVVSSESPIDELHFAVEQLQWQVRELQDHLDAITSRR